jgi:hypothetical protein
VHVIISEARVNAYYCYGDNELVRKDANNSTIMNFSKKQEVSTDTSQNPTGKLWVQPRA